MTAPTNRASEAAFYSTPERFVAGALVALSRGSLPILGVFFLARGIDSLAHLLAPVLGFSLLPALAAWAISRGRAVTWELRDGVLALRRRVRVEIPCAAIERVDPWRVPLPGPGFALGLCPRGGVRHPLAAADPAPLLEALIAAGVAAARPALEHPSVAFARARSARPGRRLQHPAVKFALFGLGPAAILFQLHQRIAFGGPFGEWLAVGALAYLRTFAVYYATSAVVLVLFSSVWRALAEGAAWAVTWISPRRAVAARRAAEAVCLASYYAGVPALLLLRLVS